MKYLSLVWAGIWRKRSRTFLMLLQIVSAFVLFGLLQGIDSGIQTIVDRAHGDRLYVMSRRARASLPIGMTSRIRAIPGVEYVSPTYSLGGTYKKLNQYIQVNAVDVADYFRVYSELQCSPPGAVMALERLRTGAIVGGALMRSHRWKVGEHIVLNSGTPKLDGSGDWGFDIVGVCENPEQPDTTRSIVMSYDYLNESLASGRDQASFFMVKIDDPARAGAVSLAIDNAFANSPNETHTQSEADLQQGNLEQVGNLGFIIRAVIGAVFFALAFATSALMMQTLRERLPELATLKALGYSDQRVMVLVLIETAVFYVCAALIGLGIAAGLIPLARTQGIAVQGVSTVPGSVFVSGIALALILALISAGVPAWRAARLSVTDALAGR
jgi:putative ABC transport system permease protein